MPRTHVQGKLNVGVQKSLVIARFTNALVRSRPLKENGPEQAGRIYK